jgi:hypothetical protein
MIRKIKISDLKKIIPVIKICYDEMGFNRMGLPFDLDTVIIKTTKAIKSKDFYAILFEEEGEVLGFGMAKIITTHFSHKELVAVEEAWNTLPSLSPFKRIKIMNGLVEAMEVWTKKKGIKKFYIGTSPYDVDENGNKTENGKNRVAGKLLMKRGYCLETLFFGKEV